ncbi:MAG: putative selenate ABC transporter substrate-binding protein, partial [Burkholderiaceae bacterium]|nr:putative selenate ABC transporter substrate-binding protein [Burkholderiaceae bacterium]
MLAFSGARAARFLVAMVLSLSGWAVHAQTVLKVTAIPDESPTELMRKAAPLV